MSGFITLHRKLLDWEWYSDINTKTVFIHCLLKANWEDKNWQGIDIKRGSFITSVQSLSKELKLTSKQIRLCFSKLQTGNELGIKTTNKYTVLTVVKYDEYQSLEIKKTNKRQTKDKQRATTNNITNKQDNISIDWDKLIEQFNSITGKKIRVINLKTKKQITTRLKEGYDKQDLLNAITNCYNDKFHKETNHDYLTLEFISRSDKMEKYANIKL